MLLSAAWQTSSAQANIKKYECEPRKTRVHARWSCGPVVPLVPLVPLVLPNPCAPVRTNPNRFELQSGTSENRAVRPAAALFVKYATQTLDFRSFQEFSGVNFSPRSSAVLSRPEKPRPKQFTLSAAPPRPPR